MASNEPYLGRLNGAKPDLEDDGIFSHSNISCPFLEETPKTRDQTGSLQLRHTFGGSERRFTTMQTTTAARCRRREELQHTFRHLSLMGFTSLVMGTWEFLLTASGPSLLNGGLAGLFYSTICAYTGQLFIVLSLAEMSSMTPSGGQSQWVGPFAPLRWRSLLSYCSGWLGSFGWQARFALDCHLIAGNIQAIAHIRQPHYRPNSWSRALCSAGAAVLTAAFNTLAVGHLSLAEGLFALCHVFALVPIVISLWVLADKQPSSAMFTAFSDNGGDWPSVGLSVLVGQASSMFTVLGSKAVANIGEEVHNAEMVVPQCMLWSYLANIPFAVIMLVTYTCNIPDVLLAVGSSMPAYVHVFQEALQSPAATVFFAVVVLTLLVMIATSTLVSTSRHLASFTRDHALLSCSRLSKTHPRLQVPLNASLMPTAFTCLISLCLIGSDVELHTLMTFSIACLMATYMVALGLLITRRLRDPERLPSAPWSLGRPGLWINCVALVYASWAFFWSFWPAYHLPTAAKANWTPLLFVIVVLGSLATYAAGLRKQSRRNPEPFSEAFAFARKCSGTK